MIKGMLIDLSGTLHVGDKALPGAVCHELRADSPNPFLRDAEGARLAGLSIDTIRAWERRYAAVVPERGAKGRLYTEAQIIRLRRLSDLVRRGHAISDVAGLSDAQLAQWLARENADGQAHSAEGGRPDASPVSRILGAIDRFDDRAADREVARLAALHPSRAFVHEVALPLMREAGERWHRGSWSVAQEHMLSAVLRTVVAGVARLEPAPDAASRLVFATPEGEQHEFGILVAAMLASGSRLGVVYLGASLPPGEIAAAVARTDPAAVVMGLTGAAADFAQLRLTGTHLNCRYPANGDVNVPQSLILRWSAGEEAAQHQVYFGDDANAVAAADTSSSLYKGAQALDNTTFAVEGLEWNRTFYWRVDEVNDASAGSPWLGASEIRTLRGITVL